MRYARLVWLGLIVLIAISAAMATDKTFTAQFTDPVSTDGTPGSGIVKVQWTFNGVTEPALTFTPVASWTGTLTKPLKDGKNVASIRVWDAQGNVGTASLEVVVDSRPPAGSITASGP